MIDDKDEFTAWREDCLDVVVTELRHIKYLQAHGTRNSILWATSRCKQIRNYLVASQFHIDASLRARGLL